MASNSQKYLSCCLYFTANALSRAITRMAEEEFASLRMSTPHAFMLMLTVDQPGITQKELSAHLHLAQSTVSRFADKLVEKGFVTKKVSGKLAQVFPTEKGREQIAPIARSWESLAIRYKEILGKSEAEELTRLTYEAHLEIEKSFQSQ